MPSRPAPVLATALVAFGLLSATTGARQAAAGADRIQPHAPNPRYWQYERRPVLLRGGTDDDNLFQWTGQKLADHLDLLASVGGNYVRNTMSSRDPGNIWPFHRLPDGRYDLERLDDEYYGRLRDLIRLAAARDVVVQIELWDRFDFAREPWLVNPYRPANNLNYTPAESGLADEYARHPGRNDNPFFRSIPDHDNNQRLLRYQHAQVDRLLSIALEYPNVLYTMDNETSASAEWGAYWARYVQRKAAEAGARVYTTEMWDAHDLTHEQHRRTLDHPELYAFADISQNNHNTGQKHWDGLQWVRRHTAAAPRPLNHVKIYGADAGPYGTDRDGVERFWRSLLGGAASIRFHRPPSGIGLNALAQASLRSARLLLADYDVFRSEPDADSRLLGSRGEGEAYLARVQERQYAVYFPDGGAVTLNAPRPAEFRLRWLDIRTARWHEPLAVPAGNAIELTTPGNGHWIALLTQN